MRPASKYAAIFEVSPAAMAILSWPEGRVVEANPAMQELLGLERSELAGRLFDELDLSAEHPGLAATIRGIQPGQRASLEAQFEDRSGEPRRVRAELVVSMLEDVPSIVVSLADVTRHVAVERALRESNETLRALIAAAPVAISVVDINERVKVWNPAAERIFGWSKDEVLGRPMPGVEDDERSRGRTIEALWRGDVLDGVESRKRRRDGAPVDVVVSAAPMRDLAGRIVGAVRVMQDVTKQKQLEEELRQAHKLEAIGRLAGGIAHDFNNLLTVILAGTEFVLDSMNLGQPVAAGDVEDIRKAGQRAAALTSQLLAFSRRQVLTPRIVDPNALVTGIDKMLRRLIGEDIRLVNALGPNLGLVRADPTQLEQVIVNLVVNARDAMPRGGVVRIETANVVRQDPRAPNGAASSVPGPAPAARWIRITVTDTGVGMDAATRAHIFEPFFTSKDRGRGTGLGLATVYGIVKQSNGKISVESEPGRGSRFDIYLPVADGAERSEVIVTGDVLVPQGKETILLVEDDEAVRRITSRTLRTGGYTVLEASDGEKAMRMARDLGKPLHLLLSDVVMPGIGGRELSERMQELCPDAKVLFMSGYTDDEILRRGLQQKEIAFLPKPFSPNVLLDRVRAVLDGGAASA